MFHAEDKEQDKEISKWKLSAVLGAFGATEHPHEFKN